MKTSLEVIKTDGSAGANAASAVKNAVNSAKNLMQKFIN